VILDAVVPAHNEAPTVAGVVRVLLDAGALRRVLVVDDGSTDGTADTARAAGAETLVLSPNRGKAEAMLAGIARVDELARDCGEEEPSSIFFCDADLLTLTPEHVRLLADHHAMGFDQTCGLRDYGSWNLLQVFAPVMTGERIVRRWVLDAVPDTCWRGYAIETVVNYIVDRASGQTCLVPLQGLDFRNKTAKVGIVRGWLAHLAMAREMADARASLEASDGLACRVRRP
jgi:polyisoprenyl-phosphate glycosyltransferase